MAEYALTWISGNLAVGRAPLSYDELNAIKAKGIDVIVNLCGEYCDLHDIERGSGFEVYYLPVADDSAPGLEELDHALAWLDEALYLGKKALVHCRHGIGRTGTFITAYLLRRGFGLKRAEAALKKIRASPSSFSQWQLLRKYRKNSGELTVIEPSLTMRSVVDLGPFFRDYEHVVEETEYALSRAGKGCGIEHGYCCRTPLSLTLMEAAYLNYRLNKGLTQAQRTEAIERALSQAGNGNDGASSKDGSVPGEGHRYLCPLSVEGNCMVADSRPLACRLFGRSGDALLERLRATLHELSKQLFFALNASFAPDEIALFGLADVVSGRFVQQYFDLITKGNKAN